MTENPTWTQRLQITSYVVHISAFIIASAAELFANTGAMSTFAGIALAAVGTGIGLTLGLPFPGDWWRPATKLGASIVLFSTAMAATGGIESTFTLMPMATIFIAAAGGGLLFALPTTISAIFGVFAAAWSTTAATDPTGFILIPAIYAITALAFSEVQRAMTTETRRAEAIVVASSAAQTRMPRLSATHELLADLVEVAQSPDINAVTTAVAAIRDVGLIVPDTPARIITGDGIALARRGVVPDHPPTRAFAVMCSGEKVADLELWGDAHDLGDAEISTIARSLEPVGLAIDNDALLQKLAGITIQRERVRLARELHDDVAPSIAAVGLALDMALMSGDLDEEQRRNLSATRSNVSRLVEQIRKRVQDLRADRSVSVVEMAHSLVAEVDADGPSVIVNIDERMPPRPAIAIELGAFMAEAFRNSLSHSLATAIWITGRITEHDGFLAVQDNGAGFEGDSSVDGHFGLVGMRERAAIIGATFELETSPGEGTVVSMTWRDDT